MTKFFRKIRQDMLKENKFNNYLFYAIGEIILIVFGILIAVSINNCKESKNLKAAEKSLYGDLLQELQIDLFEIQGNRRYNQKYLSRYNYASEIILTDTKMHLKDTLAVIAFELTKFSDFKNEVSAYEKLAASGKLELLTNKDILKGLQNLGTKYNYINRLEKNHEQLVYSVLPKISGYVRIKPLKVIKPKALYYYEFHNNVQFFIRIANEKDDIYEQTENDLNNLIISLENELK